MYCSKIWFFLHLPRSRLVGEVPWQLCKTVRYLDHGIESDRNGKALSPLSLVALHVVTRVVRASSIMDK